MKVTFLGTGSGAPTRHRNVSSLALQFDQQARMWLFDCGEGSQQQILRSPLKLAQLEKIFITHLHGDHIFGLPGLLASRSLQDGALTPVTLYGPPGLTDYVRGSMEWSRTRLRYPLHSETIAHGPVCEDEAVQVVCAPMSHGIPAFGYAVIERDTPGTFDVGLAQQMGIPPGPIYGRLKAGEIVRLEDGREIDGKSLVGPTRTGRKIAYCGDTTYTPRAVELARSADLLIHEATYLHTDLPLAERANHATAVMAAEVARQANVGLLALTHFSARYEVDGGQQLGVLLAEARAVFPNTALAHDFWTVTIPRHEPG